MDDGLNPKKCLKNLNRHQPLRTIKDKGRVCVFAVVFLEQGPTKIQVVVDLRYIFFLLYLRAYIYIKSIEF